MKNVIDSLKGTDYVVCLGSIDILKILIQFMNK